MLCLDRSYRKTKKCARAGRRRLRAPRLHDREGPALRAARLARRHARRALAARARARPCGQGRGAPARAAGVPHRVRHPGAPDRIQGVTLAKQAAYLSIAEHMAYVNPRVRSFSQYLMSDDQPRASELTATPASRAGCARARAARSRPTRHSGCRWRSRTTASTDVLWGPRAPAPAGDRGPIEVDPRGAAGGASWQRRRPRAPACTRCARRTARASATASRGPRRAASATRARPFALLSPLDIRLPWPFVRLGSRPDGPTMRDRRSFEHHENPPDAPPRPRRRRREGHSLGQVVDTYPFDGGGELEMVVLRLRRFGERRMLPVTELRLDDGRIVAPFTQHQVEDSPGLSTGRARRRGPVAREDVLVLRGLRVRARVGRAELMSGARWRPSSGCSGTARPCRTTPSPIRSES